MKVYGAGYHLELTLANKQNLPLDKLAGTVLESLESGGAISTDNLEILENVEITPGRVRLVFGLGVVEGAVAGRLSTTSNVEPDARLSGRRSSTGEKLARQSSIKTDHDSTLGAMFRWATRDPLGIIEDYGVGEPTLEQVFLRFANQQERIDEQRDEAGEEKRKKRCC